MHALLLMLSLVATTAHARYEPPTSNKLLFQTSCAHEFDSWAHTSPARREMQRWFLAYLQDPNPQLTGAERLSNVLAEMHEEAVDRLADLRESEQDHYREELEESELARGAVLDQAGTESFLLTLMGLQLNLRARPTLDLGVMPGAGVMLALLSGTLEPDDFILGDYEAEDLKAHDVVLEPKAYAAFYEVQDIVLKLRRRGRVETLREAFVPGYRYREAALFQTIDRLKRVRRRLPTELRAPIETLKELRAEYAIDPENQAATFGRMVGVLRELEDYAKLGAALDVLNVRELSEIWN